jgi:hypothetical protein
MTFRIHAEAEADIQSAVDWDEEQWEGLGDEFLDTNEEAFVAIERSPQSVFYEVSGEDIVVLAVSHQRRRPGEYQTRRS